jgi:hypothetical protein
LVWLAETAGTAGGDGLDPDQASALLCLVLLATAAAPDDGRIDTLAQHIAAFRSEDLAHATSWIFESMRADLWRELLEEHLGPLRAGRPAIAALLAALGR